MSDNGWANDGLGLDWLQEIFEKHTASQKGGDYWLLILDGHTAIVAMQQQVLIIFACKGELSHYICLLIHLICSSQWT